MRSASSAARRPPSLRSSLRDCAEFQRAEFQRSRRRLLPPAFQFACARSASGDASHGEQIETPGPPPLRGSAGRSFLVVAIRKTRSRTLSCGAAAGGSTSHCACESSGFDVDPFGRVFYPNLGQFRVEVVDTNNNPITLFGQYGNEDSVGQVSNLSQATTGLKPVPPIPLAWPTYVAVSETHAYVNDTVNRRLVRVKLAHAAEESCPVP